MPDIFEIKSASEYFQNYSFSNKSKTQWLNLLSEKLSATEAIIVNM